MATVRLRVKEVAEKKGVKNPFMLANKTGMSYSVCTKLWKGQSRISLKTLARLCEAFGGKPGQFFEYEPDK